MSLFYFSIFFFSSFLPVQTGGGVRGEGFFFFFF